MNPISPIPASAMKEGIQQPTTISLRKYLILRNSWDQVRSFTRLPKGKAIEAPERTIIILNGITLAYTSGILCCTGIAMVDVTRPRFGIIHTSFPDDIARTLEFTQKQLQSKPDNIVIGISGMSGYTRETLIESLAIAGTFGQVKFIKLGVSTDIAVDYQRRRIFGTNNHLQGIIETPEFNF